MKNLRKMTIEVYLHTYDDAKPDEKRVYRAIEQGLDELATMLSDHGHAEVVAGTLLSIGEVELPVWVHGEFTRIEAEAETGSP